MFTALLSLMACSKKEKKPDFLWSESKFIEVLTEVQITEAVVRLGIHRKKDTIIPKDSLYRAAFRKHEVYRAEFDSNFNYYLARPEKMAKIYEEVLTQISRRSALLQKKEKKLKENPQKQPN